MNEALQNLFTTTAVGLISIAAAYVSVYFHKAKQKIKSEVEQLKKQEHREVLRDALDQLDVVAENIVRAIEQTTAKDLRKEVKAGTVSREKLKNLSMCAIAEISVQMTPEYLEAIEGSILNANQYIENVIESKLLDAKFLSGCDLEQTALADGADKDGD